MTIDLEAIRRRNDENNAALNPHERLDYEDLRLIASESLSIVFALLAEVKRLKAALEKSEEDRGGD